MEFKQSPTAVLIARADVLMRRAKIALERGQLIMARSHYEQAQMHQTAALGPSIVLRPFEDWARA